MFNNLLKLSPLIPKRTFLKQNYKNFTVLGIETSCDDTGVALVNSDGIVLGEALYSQQDLHLKYGGIIPPRAQDLHRQNIEKAVTECLDKSNTNISNVNVIAVTNCPGLPLSLLIGVRYAKYLSKKYSKPLLPIHHMEAHALSVRMEMKNINYPFLCLLISGGHSQLVLIKSPTDFFLLGETLDDAPGEAFDKVARKLKLRNNPRFEWLNGGAAIELAASECENANRYEFPLPLARNRDCQFSFAGLKNSAFRTMKEVELENEIRPDEIIPYYKDFCAGFQKAVTRHLSHRTQRAIEYCERKKIFTENTEKSLVISGGVACNDYIFNALSIMADHYNYTTYRPSKQLCRDNGAMIAWNAIEKLKQNSSLYLDNQDLNEINIIGKCKLGLNIIDDVIKENISCKWIQIGKVMKS